MWDEAPYVDALSQISDPILRESGVIRAFVVEEVLRHGQRRPQFIDQVASEIPGSSLGFVYDRATSLIFFADWADHEMTAASLMALRALRVERDVDQAKEHILCRHGELADRYLEEGYGFIANTPKLTRHSGVWPLNIGTEVLLSPQERIWFRSLTVQRR